MYRFAHPVLSDCQPTADGQICKGWFQAAAIYWWTALVLRVARARGLGTRVLPYVITGVALVALSAAFTTTMLILDYPYFPEEPPALVMFLLRLFDPTGVIGLALLVLAWLERQVALAAFALAYLVVALVPINFGWGVGWGPNWGFAPQLVINGGLLLLGSAGFALAQRLRRPR
ncbi:hypothetical protein GCM10009682_57400 [Luedemannella flava]|uniref:Uncharacterized protein n=1 Tax=Luedemannella flava TaxID=349316 RepID=A0ABN2MPH9_9ACTN